MGIADWVLLGVIGIAALAALRYTKKHKSRCIGCGGDCEACGKR